MRVQVHHCKKCGWELEPATPNYVIRNECPDCKSNLHFINWESPREDAQAEEILAKTRKPK